MPDRSPGRPRGRAAGGIRPAALDVDVAVRCRRWLRRLPNARARCRRAARAAFRAAAPDAPSPRRPGEAGVTLADDAFVRALNRDYRRRDRPTDVLSFAAADAPFGSGRETADDARRPRLLGDVVVALETAEADARRQEKRLGDHLSHLVVHGMLHLLGYDHVKRSDARVMEKLEVSALARLGIADPYRPISTRPSGKGRRR
jgi:probable rRNA maturation factor